MNRSRCALYLAGAMSAMMLGACSGTSSEHAPAQSSSASAASTTASVRRAPAPAPATATSTHAAAVAFTPPSRASIPDNHFGALVRKGEKIFTHTRQYAGKYVGDGLSCSNCHLNAGRRANSAPLWAAYVRYPRYRSKNHKVNSYTDRLQGCFRFSMNGTPPPSNGEVIKALTAYSYWLATGAPTGAELSGVGFPDPGEPAQPPSYARGKKVFASHCALCHGDHGQGRKVADEYVFPPLWGPESFNWGAGMHKVDTAAAFIKANMPFSRGGTLTTQQAWDVAMYMDSHERPQDPRFAGSVAQTRKKYHGSKWSLYGKTVHGHVLGSGTSGGNP